MNSSKLGLKFSTIVFISMVMIWFLSPLSIGASEGRDNPHSRIVFDTAPLDTGVTLEYAEKGHGKGNVIIFLHGYSDSWYSYSTVLELLPPKYHAYALTQRGHGDSDKPAEGYSMQDFAADVAAFMNYKNISKATVVGHSMGSIIAQRVAIDYPERVKKLVLVGSIANASSSQLLQEFLEYVYTLEDPIDPAFVYDFQVGTLYQPVPELFINTVIEESMKVPARVWQGALAGLLASNHLPLLSSITAPTLIIWGDKDETFFYQDQLELDAGISDSILLIYEETGHGVHWERPQRFVDDLVEFIH